MPAHAIAGHFVVVFAPMTALIALVYAVSVRARAGMRWPLLLGSVASAVLVIWAGQAGGALLERVRTNGSAPEVAAATAHAKGSDNLAIAVFDLLAMALALAFWLLRPGRTVGRTSRVAAALLALSAVAVLATTWITLAEALTAVWNHHPSWTG